MDIILVVEALSSDFVRRFWQFIGKEAIRSRVSDEEFYRFINSESYLKYRTILSTDLIAEVRTCILLRFLRKMKYRLSAILLDDAYYYLRFEFCITGGFTMPPTGIFA